jgi:GntR family transcriptional regulator / MocR family aminotransferase
MRERFTQKHTSIILDPTVSTPLYKQLYEELRSAILRGQLQAGARLPSTRAFALELGISRATVQLTFAQLSAEGYLQGRAGSGTYVAATFPPEEVEHPVQHASPGHSSSAGRTISARANLWLSAPYFARPLLQPGQGLQRAFRVGLPAIDAFPRTLWQHLLLRSWRQMSPELLAYHQHPAGYLPLREAIASYLATARGVRCTAEQVIIVTGSQQGLDLAARVLLDPGQQVWMEDPGYPGARGALLGTGAQLVPVPVDAQGLVVQLGKERAPQARLAFVTPSHQFPLGVTMSMARRLSLLEWASAAGAWIVEDDYDSEFRYVGRPLAALQGIDRANRVLYLGTVSKVLFPAVRLGYLVVPPDLVNVFIAARLFSDIHPPLLEQVTLTAFLHEGHFVRHIRQMRQLYQQRQGMLVELARKTLAGGLDLQPAAAGMHLIGWLPGKQDDRQVARAAARVWVDVSPLSLYALAGTERTGILLGYTAVGTQEMRAGLERLASVLVRSQ